MVSASELPYTEPALLDNVVPPLRTGGAGRPSPMGLIADEMKRRHQGNTICSSLEKEANELATWYDGNRPEKWPLRVTPKAIKEALRNQYRQLVRGSSAPT
jgi:hypothetical protein